MQAKGHPNMNAPLRLIHGAKIEMRSVLSRIANAPHFATLADPPQHDDLYVVSFPKSGATWVNFLMANLHLRMSGVARNVTFFNVHDFVPDIEMGTRLALTALPSPGHRVIKSHSGYNPYYRKVIYLVRDPRAAIVSYHHFLVGLGQVERTISETIRSPEHGIEAWCRHVSSWFERTEAATSFMTMRYEDLRADPAATLRATYRQLGHDLDDVVLAQAIEASSFENMKALEREYGYGGRRYNKNLTFVRKGRAAGWKDEVSAADIAFIEERAGDWMERLGYTVQIGK